MSSVEGSREPQAPHYWHSAWPGFAFNLSGHARLACNFIEPQKVAGELIVAFIRDQQNIMPELRVNIVAPAEAQAAIEFLLPEDHNRDWRGIFLPYTTEHYAGLLIQAMDLPESRGGFRGELKRNLSVQVDSALTMHGPTSLAVFSEGSGHLSRLNHYSQQKNKRITLIKQAVMHFMSERDELAGASATAA